MDIYSQAVSKNVEYQLKNVSFSNILTFTLMMLVLQITTVLGIKNPGTLASHNCTKDPLPCNKVFGAAFLLIMIMLQAKFLFVRVHSFVASNILCEKI